MQQAFELLVAEENNKTSLEAGVSLFGINLFGVNTRYTRLTPAEQYNLALNLVSQYTEQDADNLSEEDLKGIEERKQIAEQNSIQAERSQANNLVNITNKILKDNRSFNSEKIKRNL